MTASEKWLAAYGSRLEKLEYEPRDQHLATTKAWEVHRQDSPPSSIPERQQTGTV